MPLSRYTLTALALLSAHRLVADESVRWLTDARGCKIQDPSPLPHESVTWTGECVSGWAAGDGTLTWFIDGKPNSQFKGTLKSGRPGGHGIYPYADGAPYKGESVGEPQDQANLPSPSRARHEDRSRDGIPQHHTLFPDHTTVLNVCVKDDGTFESATQMISSGDLKTDTMAMGVAQIQHRNPDPKTGQIDTCFTIGVKFLNEAISVMELRATD